MDICTVLFVLLLVPCSTMSQDYIINLTSADTTMNIISPNYPDNYGDNLDIVWQVIAPTGFRVLVQFTDFNLEWSYDTLGVYHALTNSFEDATQRALISGSSLPDNISSIGSYLWLWFKTDSTGRRSGFSLMVSAVKTVIINLTSEGTIVTITSTNFPNNYGNNEDILWQVIAPTGFRVMVQFNDFELRSGDSLSVYHGLTNSLVDATRRARLSGSSLPDNISSIGSYLWLWFTSDGSVTRKGFSLMVRAVKPDWACDFKEDTCGLLINRGSWTMGEQANYYFIEADESASSFTIPHAFTLVEGSISFGLYRRSKLSQGQFSQVTVTVCKSQNLPSIRIPYRRVVYENIRYSCSGIQDIEVTFTESGSQFRPIRVFDIQLFEISGPSTASPSTVGMQTTPFPSSLPESTQPMDKSTQGSVTPGTSTPETVSKQSTDTSIGPSASTSGGISTKNPTNPTNPTSVDPSKGQASNVPTSPGTKGSTNLRTDEKASTLTHTTPTVTLPVAEELGGGSNLSLIPALSSAIVLILVIMVIIAVFVLRRRRFQDPKVAEPVDQEDDDPNLYNNPVYCSKDDGLPIPDLIISTSSHTSSLSQARHPSTYMDNQYEEFEGDRHPVTNADGSLSHHDALRDTTSESNSSPYYTLEDPSNQDENSEVLDEGDYHTYEQAQGPQPSKKPGKKNEGQTGTDDVYQELNNTPLSIDPYSSLASPNSGPKQGHSNGPAVLDDDEEYNALTFNQSSDITRAMKKPTSGGEGVNNGYGVLDLPKQEDSNPSVNSPQLHNDDVYNTLNEGPQEQHNGKQQAPDQSSGYQALKLGQSNIPISHQDLSHKMGSTDNRSTGGYQSLSPGTKGPGPKAGSYERNQPGDESEYHSYQDPSQMNQDGSARTPTEPDIFSSDEYNILNSGKEVGDYHVYQATDDTSVDEGNYEDLDPKTRREDEYSEIGQGQNHAPGTTDKATFEPIYSDEVYSEFR